MIAIGYHKVVFDRFKRYDPARADARADRRAHAVAHGAESAQHFSKLQNELTGKHV